MKIGFKDQYRKIRIRSRALIRLVRRVLAEMGKDKAEVGLILTGDAEIRRLNRHYRGIDRATDVLAFAMNDPASGLAQAVVQALPDHGGRGAREDSASKRNRSGPTYKAGLVRLRRSEGIRGRRPHGPPQIKAGPLTLHLSPDRVDTYPHLLGDVVI